jgi:adenine-specific DNA-methyltransferase
LRPCEEESVDFDITQNLYIEGDNLEVLKLLQETYLGKIKMIYIDPPYNTGNDFVYNDDFSQDSEEYLDNSGQYDEYGNRLVQNTESNGRFHTDWLNMIYPRLRLAKDLLSDDGVIFISIDDNEVENIRKISDEIFGESNYITAIPRLTSAQRPSQEKYISIQHDYILVYVKDRNNTGFSKTIVRSGLENVKQDHIGLYFEGDTSPILASSTQGYSKGGDYDFTYNGIVYKPIANDGSRRRWLWTIDRMQAAAELGILVPTKSGLRVQNYIDKEFQVNTNKMVDKDMNLILATYDFMNSKFTNNHGTAALKDLGLSFSFSKPVELIKEVIKLSESKDIIVLDFFSGSATTAHAVMQLNAEDGGNRKFIMVQLPELCDEKSEAYKAGYKNICEIGKERIRRAGKKIKNENGLLAQNLDIGFRLLKLDSSNMKDVYYRPEDYNQSLLDMFEDNIKEDRTPLDLLFQVMLELGKPLSAKIEEKEITGKHVFVVDGNDLIACFDKDITDEVVKTIAQMKPLYAVFRDSSMANDSVGTNFEQIFATYSPNTTRKVL